MIAIARIHRVPWWRRALAWWRSIGVRRSIAERERARIAEAGRIASAAANQAQWDAWVRSGDGRHLIDAGYVRPPPTSLPGLGVPRLG